ncbi:MAG: GNAT family N-acetyltransferase [Acidimicrobiia bacterium]
MTPLPPPTERLRFREYRDADLDDVVAMLGDSQSRRFYPEMDTPDACRGWIEWSKRNYRDHGFGLWAIEDLSTGEFLGDCGLTYQPVEGNRLLELGYHLLAEHRGKGLVTEAGRACLDYAFDQLKEAMVCSTVHPENAPSIAVARRLHAFERTYLKDGGQTRLLFWTGAKPSG